MNETEIAAILPSAVLDRGDAAWILTSTALVMIMVPGVGYFYSGLARSKNALSLIMLSMLSLAVVSFQWWLWGYSLAFNTDGGPFLGTLNNAFMMNVRDDVSTTATGLTSMLFAIFQGMFAAITPALAIGSAAERGRILPTIVFIFIWSTIVYDPIACWTWNPNGWAFKLGVLDFAGGTPVHISSGAAALAYCLIVGKRHGHGTDEFKPHNVANVVLGTVFLWFGWFGFNGGSAGNATARAAMASCVTNIAASVGGITWMLLDYRLERKLSVVGFCSGAVAGLVAITPGSGFVAPHYAVVFGIVAGICCNAAVKLKHIFDFDDALDVFAVHGVGGLSGNIMTGIFAQQSIYLLDPSLNPALNPNATAPIDGGWVDGNWIQVPRQLADSAAGMSYSFCITYLILFIMDKIPGLAIRADHETETRGLDEAELGELAYYHVDRLITVNTRTGETKSIKEETVHQGNDTNVTIV